jgi:hypothetical protein
MKISVERFRRIINRFNNTATNETERIKYDFNKDIKSEKYITLESLGNNGRLGNQLFQIASTVGIGIKNNVNPIFSSWYCSYTNKNMSKYFKNSLKYSNDIRPLNRYVERHFNYNQIDYKDNMIIRGYYQSEKYFNHCEDLIRFYFSPSDEIYDKINSIYSDMIPEGKKSCSIHIRRGDYVNHPVHGVCDLDYYKKGIVKIKELAKIDYFIIFSDDIDWCKKNFKGEDFLFSEGLLDIEDIFLLSFCDNHIISNSSFSWWGSWLCKNTNKKIITPRFWFKPEAGINDRDIFPKNSIKI